MQKLSTLPASGSGKLSELINKYNELNEDQDIEKLFYLQQINYFFQKTTTKPELIAWRNQLGESGLEAHLQHYGIHRDSSPLLQSIEFAKAVQLHAPSIAMSNITIYDAMTSRDKLLKGELNSDTLAAYVNDNQAIMANFNASHELQEKIQRSILFLALSYGKIDAIQSFVKQQVDGYQTTILGNPEGNNKNFIFAIEGEDKKIVIRVEDRHDLGKEQELQTHAVSDYFSEDYATIMVPFDVDGEVDYRPVVISELVTQGDLASYAKKFIGEENDEIVNTAQHFFTQLNDFCLKLMDSGHYHPDIKLSNFLTDGERVIISDRKTIVDKKSPKVTEISSSPLYGAPEYKACVSESGDSLKASAHRTILDMPSYMAYQMGMALKEFLFTTVKGVKQDTFEEWSSFTNQLEGANDTLKNMDVLVLELTRTNPKDRLSIQHFQTLLSQAHLLSHERFMAELERLSPEAELSTSPALQLLKQVLTAETLTPDLQTQLTELKKSQSISTLCQDPRLGTVLAGKPMQHINDYLKQVEAQLLLMDLEKAYMFEKVMYNMGLGIPSRTSVAELGDALPKMDEMTQLCFNLSENIPGITPRTQRQVEEIMHCSVDEPTEATEHSTASILRLTSLAAAKSSSRKTSQSSAIDLASGTMIINEPSSPDSDISNSTGSSFDSGTMIINEPLSPDSDISNSTGSNFDSGTMITNEPSSPDSDISNSTGSNFDSGTMVVNEPSVPDSGTMVTNAEPNTMVTTDEAVASSSPSGMQGVLNFMKHNKGELISSATPKGKDILSTIKRGDKTSDTDENTHPSPTAPK